LNEKNKKEKDINIIAAKDIDGPKIIDMGKVANRKKNILLFNLFTIKIFNKND